MSLKNSFFQQFSNVRKSLELYTPYEINFWEGCLVNDDIDYLLSLNDEQFARRVSEWNGTSIKNIYGLCKYLYAKGDDNYGDKYANLFIKFTNWCNSID